ncbi:hypothetical protein [Botrimarina colliarenosi]|uniref:hypothetical protein n=1 Tax=Botrimarina colliarenosi TaxID=2528001 RepID=UPI0011B6B189|nr:hypothetical protein [Botrimarina colliarenosi]
MLVTVAGYTTDTDNAFTSATGSFVGTNSASFPSGTFTTPAEQAVTFGRLVAGGSGARRATVGSFDNRDVITLTFGAGLQLKNEAGNDIVVYEQGDANQPEAYAVAVRQTGSATFTDFRYEIWDAQEGFQLATAFDLTSFGLSSGQGIDAIMIANLVQTVGVTDYTFGGGEGFVESVPANTQTAGYQLPIGYGASKDGLFPLGEYDPDISYVGVFHQLSAIPEPSAVLFGTLLASALGMTVARRRRDAEAIA